MLMTMVTTSSRYVVTLLILLTVSSRVDAQQVGAFLLNEANPLFGHFSATIVAAKEAGVASNRGDLGV
jgi:hypothetical protein